MSPVFVAYGALSLAIVCEIVGTALLQKTAQFTKLGPTFWMIVFYVGSTYFLTHAVKVIPMGIAYAIWFGVGIVLTAVVSYFLFKQSLDLPALIGMGMIIGGVVVVNLFSKSVGY